MQSTIDRWRHLVVHCKKSKYDVYVGRTCKGMPVPNTIWGNPFVMRDQSDAERVRVITEYKEWLLQQPDLVQRARVELRGKVLACWCAPLACHGHILAEIANTDDVAIVPESRGISLSANVAQLPPDTNQSIASADTPLHPAASGLTAAQRKNRRRTEVRRKKRLEGDAVNPAAPTAEVSSVPDKTSEEQTSSETCSVIDIGINITSKQLLPHWKNIVSTAFNNSLSAILLTGTSIRCTEQSLRIATEWNGDSSNCGRLYCTAGVHPHEAKTYTAATTTRLRSLLQHDLVVAVGECGLDYNRNFSTKQQQLHAFREQVQLAVDLQMPLFIHEREAHTDLVAVLDAFGTQLPPVVIHCFTGTAAEARAYINRGYSIGFTGTICKRERGAPLRDILSKRIVPLHRIMLETDAPWMSFRPDRRISEPADVNYIAEEMAKCLEVDVVAVRRVTTQNAQKFFKLV